MPAVRRATRASTREKSSSSDISNGRHDEEVNGVDASYPAQAARISYRIFERRRAWRLAIIRPYAAVHHTGLWMAILVALATILKTSGMDAQVGSPRDLCPKWAEAVVFKTTCPATYENSYEIVCEVLSWIGAAARHYALLRGITVWRPLRPLTMATGIVSLRYEFSKQAGWFLARCVADAGGHAGRRYLEGAHGGDYARCFAAEIPMCLVKIAFGLSLHWGLERRDRARFLEAHADEDARHLSALPPRRRRSYSEGEGRGSGFAGGESGFARGTGVAIVAAVGFYAFEHMCLGC
jgi:hypothetical protein